MLGDKIDKTNSLLDEIKEWLFEEQDLSEFEAETHHKETFNPQSFFYKVFLVLLLHVLPSRTLSMTMFTGRSFQKLLVLKCGAKKLSISWNFNIISFLCLCCLYCCPGKS